MRTLVGSPAAKLLALLVLSIALPACQPKPGAGPGLGSPGVISCATEAIAAAAPTALGPVNACLAGTGDIQSCLLSLINPAANITIGTIGCLTRREGSAASAASKANPFDEVDARKAQRAAEFLEKMRERNYEFRD